MTETVPGLDPALNRLPEQIASIHLMGVGGTAMAALAGMLVSRGYQVSGSDNPLYPPMSELLAQLGIPIFSGYRPENLNGKPDLVVVGNVISRDNPEAQALAALGLPYLSMPQILAQLFLKERHALVVSGTHGKTTTASMLASALHTLDSDPSFMIGGIVRDFAANYRLGKGPFFVIEGDEYDTAFFDKGSKFLHYRPDIAIITSIEFDHADIFSDLDAIKRSFQAFVSLLPASGLIVANLDDEMVAEVVRDAPCPVQGYGCAPGLDWRLSGIKAGRDRTEFSLEFQGKQFATLAIRQPGLHNCLNATAVAAVLYRLGFNRSALSNGLASFHGVRRRQEIRGIVDGITVIDDFAHHPTAVRETLRALRQAYAGNRLLAVFEPRSNTSRRSLFQEVYATSFAAADLAIIKEPPVLKVTDREDRLSAEQLAADIRRHGVTAHACSDTESILRLIEEEARPGDVIAILSNGGFDNIHVRLLDQLQQRCPEDSHKAGGAD